MARNNLFSLLSLLLAGCLLGSTATLAAQRAASYADALKQAGPDGIMVYCYGADWNAHSVRMLESFWNTPALEEAAGDAVLVAQPLYANPEAPGAKYALHNAYLMEQRLDCGVPYVAMLTKEGKPYAVLTGVDGLGEGSGEVGCRNIADKLDKLRKLCALQQEAAALSGKEKARRLGDMAKLGLGVPYQTPLLQELAEADPQDELGIQRGIKHNAWTFIAGQLNFTFGGFRPVDDDVDLEELRKACLEIARDEAYRPADRQAALGLLAGEMRRMAAPPGNIKALLRKAASIDKTTHFGRMLPTLVELWGAVQHLSPEERKWLRARKKNRRAQDKAKKRLNRRSGRDIEFNDDAPAAD